MPVERVTVEGLCELKGHVIEIMLHSIHFNTKKMA